MVLFVSNPTNVVICEGFMVNNAAFSAYTILPFLACSMACFSGLAIQFYNSKHVPKKLNYLERFRPLTLISDPIGAIVGSIMLIVCLTVTVVLPVDAWMVALPFTVAKFIFDLVWDYYRFLNNKIDDMEEILRMNIRRARGIYQATTLDETLAARATPIIPIQRTFSPEQIAQPHVETNSLRDKIAARLNALSVRFPTFFKAFPHLPFALIPFVFSQFILIEGLAHRGWIDVFSQWLVKASGQQMIPTIWLVGVLGIFLCNRAGTNIGATILLTKIVRAAQMPDATTRAAAIALAVASNIGAVNFTFSASLAGLLWRSILLQKGIKVDQVTFGRWSCLPLLLMTVAGLGVVTAEMLVLYK